MKPIPVILDCDPGVDDAIAFLLAKQLPQLNVLAITSAALGSKQAVFFRDVVQDIVRFMRRLGVIGINMHDPAAVLYACLLYTSDAADE